MQNNAVATTGVVLVNLGTPSAPTPQAVRAFLGEFLSDKRVIDLPRAIWLPILYGIVLRLRPPRIAKLYQNIWLPEGSPMRVIGQQQAAALCQALEKQCPEKQWEVCLAMRYGEPSIKKILQSFQEKAVNEVIILPLFPQYSATTTAAVFDAITNFYQTQVRIPHLRFIQHYGVAPAYIAALAQSVETYWQQHGRGEKLVMSFHGIPLRYVTQGDPYAQQCEQTAHALAAQLDLSPEQWCLTYQSRFGYAKWLAPYTDETLKTLAQQGVKRVDVISPAFAADCLETLEELAITNKELFLHQGGKDYHYIPALNDDPQVIKSWVQEILK